MHSLGTLTKLNDWIVKRQDRIQRKLDSSYGRNMSDALRAAIQELSVIRWKIDELTGEKQNAKPE